MYSGFLQVFVELREPSQNFACSDSISHNRVQVLSIPVLLLTCSQDWTCYLQMNVSLEKTIVWKPLMIKIIKLCLRNLDN